MSCKTPISAEEAGSTEEASRWAFHVEGGNVGQAPVAYIQVALSILEEDSKGV